ncbi:VIT domain-containing protein, partial [Butyriboletus roseoflavus]
HTGIVHQPHGKTVLECLPLEEVTVKAWVVDISSRIVLSQTFYNPSDEPTGRAKYVFPLPANAAVCAFELELEDGSVIIGEVKEKEEAALTFTRAVEQGKPTALVERVTDDIFTMSVGSIPATTRVTVYLT